MADLSIAHKPCTRCKINKPISEFHKHAQNPSGHRPRCKDCRKITEPHKGNRNRRIETACGRCGKVTSRRSDQLKIWSGYCVHCSASVLAETLPPSYWKGIVEKCRETKRNWTPERRAAHSEMARRMLAKRGGRVPNAKPFTSSGPRHYAGDKHWAWRGGTTKGRHKDMRTARYIAWRKAVYARDDYTCQMCGVRGGRLNADHILPYSTHVELRYELSNGRTLCTPCHCRTDTYGAKALRYLIA